MFAALILNANSGHSVIACWLWGEKKKNKYDLSSGKQALLHVVWKQMILVHFNNLIYKFYFKDPEAEVKTREVGTLQGNQR